MPVCNGLILEVGIGHPWVNVWMGTGGDDAGRCGVVGVATGCLHDRLVLRLLGIGALQQRAHGRPVGFV